MVHRLVFIEIMRGPSLNRLFFLMINLNTTGLFYHTKNKQNKTKKENKQKQKTNKQKTNKQTNKTGYKQKQKAAP